MGLVELRGTASTLNGLVDVRGGGLQVTDFRSFNNVSGTLTLGNGGVTDAQGGSLLIGTPSIDPGGTAALTLQRVVNLNTDGGNAAIYANQTGTNGVIINSNLVVTSPRAKTFILAGTSTANNAFNGVIANGTSTATISLLKQGSGVWVLGGSNTYTGTTTISNGTLKLQANAVTSTILADSGTVAFDATNGFAGGTLEFVGQSGTNHVETIGALLPTAGAATLRLTPGSGGNASLVFSALGTQGQAATVNVVGSSSTSTVTLTGVATGLVGPGFHFGGADFAYSNAGVLRAPSYGTDPGFSTNSGGVTLGTGTNFNITGDITAQTTGSAATLRFSGSSTLTLSSGSLTVRTGAAGTSGGILATGGASTITGGTLTTAGAGTLVARVDGASDQLTIASILQGFSGGLTKSGAGVLVLSGSNQQTGATNILEGTVRLSGASRLSGANITTNIRQYGTLDVNGLSTDTAIGQFNNNGTITNSSATAGTLVVGNNNGAGTSFGVMQSGSGVLNVTKVGTGAQSWLGLSTYTGTTRITDGSVTVDVLADIGQPSGIGSGTSANNAGSLIFDGTSTARLIYRGTPTDLTQGGQTFSSRQGSTNRLFTLAGSGATLESNASLGNAIVWSNTDPIAFGTSAAQTITFQGTSTGDNLFFPQITDNTQSGNAPTSVTKSGTGIWALGNTNNTYSGPTTIQNGNLWFASAGSLPATSPLVIGATSGNGVFLGSGTFTRALAATAVSGSQSVTFSAASGAGAGFAALDKLVVAIGGTASPTTLVWGGGTGFLPDGASLVLGSSVGLAEVEIRNPINLNGAGRTVNVLDNTTTGADFATISGPISGSGGLVKTGAGMLALTGPSTYSGTTNLSAGVLAVTSLGSTKTGGPSSLGTGVAANTNANALTLSGGILQYVGSGETSDRKIQLNASTVRIFADGAGPLVLETVANDLANGARTLELRGSNVGPNEITSNLANSPDNGALSVRFSGNAFWVFSGQSTYTGQTNIGTNQMTPIVGVGSSSVVTSGTLVSGPFGTGTVAISNGFSSGFMMSVRGPQTVANPISWGNNESFLFGGDYDLTFTGSVAWGIAGSAATINNVASPGATLTFNRLTANSVTTGDLTVDGQGNTTIGSIESTNATNSMPLTKNGTGVLTLGTGTFAHRGNTTVSGGVLLLSASTAVTGTNSTPYTVNAGGAVATGFAIDQTFINRVVNTSAGVVALGADSANNLNFSGTASGGSNFTAASLGAVGSVARIYSGTLTPNGVAYRLGGGGGTLDFQTALTGASNTLTVGGPTSGLGGTVILSSATNSYGGATTVNLGTLQIASLANAGSNSSLGMNASITLGSGTNVATLRYAGSGTSTSDRTITIGSTVGGIIDVASGGLNMATGTISVTNANTTVTLTGSLGTEAAIGPINGAGVNVTKTGPGVWRLAGNGTYSGRLTVLDGTVVVPSVVGTNTPFGSNTEASSLPLIGNSAVGASGTVALLAQSGTVARGFWIAESNGAQVAVIGATGSGTTTFATGHAIRLGRDVTLQASNDGTVVFANDWYDFSPTGTTPAVAFTIGSPGNAGTVTFGKDIPSQIKSVNIVAGTLKPDGNGRIGLNTPVLLGSSSSAGTFDLNGFYQSLPSLSFTGTGSRVINGSLALYNGGTAAPVTVSGSGHEISSAVSLDDAATFNVGSGSRLLVSGGMGNPNEGQYGVKGFTKSGPGILELTEVNTYSGATSITGGQLRVTAGNINGSSGITINGGELKYNSGSSLTSSLVFAGSGGTLSGTGTINTPVTAGTGAILSPGNSPGIQPYASGLTWAPGGTYEWELNAMSGTAGTNWDLIDVTSGTFSLATLSTSNTFMLDLVTLTAAGGNTAGPLDTPYSPGDYSFLIADFGGASFTVPAGFSTAAGSDLTGLFTFSLARWQSPAPNLSDLSVKVNSTGDGIELVIVPEPTALAIAALGIAAAAACSHRARRRKTPSSEKFR